MIEKLKNWLLGALVAFAIFGGIVAPLNRCSPAVEAPMTKQRVDTVLVARHDTLVKLDTVLKTRIKYIDTSRIDTVHNILDHYIPIDTSDNDGNQVISANQLREAVKWKDSLITCLEMRKVDSGALDSVSKIAKNAPDTIKIAPSVFDRAKDIGIGVLVGAGIRSFF